MNIPVQTIKDEIRCMFDKISYDYDFLNNLISLFTHFFIKKRAIKYLKIKNASKVLDICTGTGDLAHIVKENCPNCEVYGIDFSQSMLNIAKSKYSNIEFYNMDAAKLLFSDNTFDYVIVGFGLRNIPDKKAALLEINRVLIDGGYFLHLDFGEKNFASKILDILIIFMAKIFSKNFEAYEYLNKSRRNFFTPDEFIDYVLKCNFKFVLRKDFLFKTISFEIFKKI